MDGTGLSIPGTSLHKEAHVRLVNSVYDLQAIPYNHCTLEFLDLLLSRYTPTVQDNAVYSKSYHDVLRVDQVEYQPSVAADTLALVELCTINEWGSYSEILNVNSPAEIITTSNPNKAATKEPSHTPHGANGGSSASSLNTTTGPQGALNKELIELIHSPQLQEHTMRMFQVIL